MPLYPSNAWARGAAAFSGWDELWERLWENSVDVGGPHVSALVDACARHDIHCVIGVNEREDERPGIALQRDAHARARRARAPPPQADADDAGAALPRRRRGRRPDVVELPGIGRVGGLICWENRMPLARYAVYEHGPQIWVAPTADDSEGWIASMRHIAIESGAYVVSVPQYIPASAFPDDFPVPLPEGKDGLRRWRGGDRRARRGRVVAGPLYGEEGMLLPTATCERGCTRSARSTPSGTTAAPRSSAAR